MCKAHQSLWDPTNALLGISSTSYEDALEKCFLSSYFLLMGKVSLIWNGFESLPQMFLWMVLLWGTQTDTCRISLFLTTCTSPESLPVISPRSCYYYRPFLRQSKWDWNSNDLLNETLKVVLETSLITAPSGDVSGHQGSNILFKMRQRKSVKLQSNSSFFLPTIIQTNKWSQLELILIVSELMFKRLNCSNDHNESLLVL